MGTAIGPVARLMGSLVNLFLGLLGAAVLVFLVAMAVSSVRMRLRRRSFTGRFQAALAGADDSLVDLGDPVDDEVSCRAAIVRALADPGYSTPGRRMGWVLAETTDGEWIVADEVHSL